MTFRLRIFSVVALLALCLMAGGCGAFSNEIKADTDFVGADGKMAEITEKMARPIPLKTYGCVETTDENGVVHGISPEDVHYVIYGRDTDVADGKASFAAVGDVMGTEMNLPLADAAAGSMGDGLYDFSSFYDGVREILTGYDMKFLNQETMTAGTDDGREYSGYPTFNTPDTMVDAYASAGFNIVGLANNHAWDMEAYGIERTHQVIGAHTGIMIVGSFLTEEDRRTVMMYESGGIDFAFLAYTYGDNHYGDASGYPNTYYSCPFNEQEVAGDVSRAKSVADVVIAYVHWGDEYQTAITDQQWEYAQFLADQGVDLIIGSHAHIPQPVKYITSSSGKTIPVAFGLSNFICGWTVTRMIISGVFTCEFEWQSDEVAIVNPALYPAIEWSDGGPVSVRLLKDMDEATINANTRTEDIEDDVGYIRQFIQDLGNEIPVVM